MNPCQLCSEVRFHRFNLYLLRSQHHSLGSWQHFLLLLSCFPLLTTFTFCCYPHCRPAQTAALWPVLCVQTAVSCPVLQSDITSLPAVLRVTCSTNVCSDSEMKQTESWPPGRRLPRESKSVQMKQHLFQIFKKHVKSNVNKQCMKKVRLFFGKQDQFRVITINQEDK